MKALVITLPPDRWPRNVPHHFHIVDNAISNHVVGAVMAAYGKEIVKEYEWTGDPPICFVCQEPIGVQRE